MGVQFDRIYEIQVGTAIVRDVDVRFKVVRTLSAKPNTCEITLYNLADSTRGAMSEAVKTSTVQISAGYRGRPETNDALVAVDAAIGESRNYGVIFLGDVRDVRHAYWPPDWETSIEGGDGERQVRTARVNKSYAKGTPVGKVLNDLAKSMGLGAGNAAQAALTSAALTGGGAVFANGVTVSGQAHRELENLVKSAGKELSIQGGVLQILDRGLPLQDVSIVLTETTGLVGAPEIGDKGIVKIRALMNPDIVPGRQIELTSRSLTGRYRAERCEYTGDLQGQEWYVDVEARAL